LVYDPCERIWLSTQYSTLDRYLQQQGFSKGNANNNLNIKVNQDSILIIEVYVDEIIFGSDDDRIVIALKFPTHAYMELALLHNFPNHC
jgi:hypothetical protein